MMTSLEATITQIYNQTSDDVVRKTAISWPSNRGDCRNIGTLFRSGIERHTFGRLGITSETKITRILTLQ
ncbi:hypothetical protein ACJBU6_07345 [Exserohilum turcicum]